MDIVLISSIATPSTIGWILASVVALGGIAVIMTCLSKKDTK